MFGARKKARFYHQLTTLLKSGTSVTKAMELLGRQSATGMAPSVAAIQSGLSNGQGLGDAMAEAPDVGIMESSIMAAAERGGKLEEGSRHLAEYYDLTAELWRSVLGSMAYPLLVLHVAIFLPGLVQMVSGNAGIWSAMILPLLVAWIVIALLIFGGNWLWRGGGSSTGIDRVLNKIPFLGSFRRKLALSRFCKVLEIQLKTGGQVSEAVKAAGNGSGAAGLRQESHSFAKTIAEQGCPLGPLLLAAPVFPAPLSQVLNTAESVGRLDEECGIRAAEMMREAGGAAKGSGVWLPRLLYAPIAAYAIYRIFSIYFGYLNTLTSGIDI